MTLTDRYLRKLNALTRWSILDNWLIFSHKRRGGIEASGTIPTKYYVCFLKEPSWRISFVVSAELSEVFCLANWWLFYSLRGKYREFTTTCFQLWTGIMWKQFKPQKKNYYPWNVQQKILIGRFLWEITRFHLNFHFLLILTFTFHSLLLFLERTICLKCFSTSQFVCLLLKYFISLSQSTFFNTNSFGQSTKLQILPKDVFFLHGLRRRKSMQRAIVLPRSLKNL